MGSLLDWTWRHWGFWRVHGSKATSAVVSCRGAAVVRWEEGPGASRAGGWAAHGLSCRHLSGPGRLLLSFMPLASARTGKASFTPLGFSICYKAASCPHLVIEVVERPQVKRWQLGTDLHSEPPGSRPPPLRAHW